MLLSKAHIYTRGDRTFVRGGQYSYSLITLTKDMDIVAHTERGQLVLGHVNDLEVEFGDFDIGPTIREEITRGVQTWLGESHLPPKGDKPIWVAFDLRALQWVISDIPHPTLPCVATYEVESRYGNFLRRGEHANFVWLRGVNGSAGWCRGCRLEFPITRVQFGTTSHEPKNKPATKPVRFVHTSTHDSKVSLVFQLSYILTAYSEAKTTLKELSAKIGVSVSALSRIKNGHETGYTLDTVLRIADELDLAYRLVTERYYGTTTHHTYVEPAVDYCNRKELKFAAIALATVGANSHINTPVH